MEHHMRPVLTNRIPTVRLLLRALFQERISYFNIYVLLL
jgi:hypothetical protein